MKKSLDKQKASFGHAFDGIRWAFTHHPNFRIHSVLTIGVLAASWYFSITRLELVILLFAITLGFVAEMINTSIESMTDLITSEWREHAKIAKDVSAGMMLVVAIGDSVIAGIIFVPYIMEAFA